MKQLTFCDRRVPKHFWYQIILDADNDMPSCCWIWGGAVAPNGYPLLDEDHVKGYAHTFVRKCLGVSFKGKATFLCGNKLCVNPDHIHHGYLPKVRKPPALRPAHTGFEPRVYDATHKPAEHEATNDEKPEPSSGNVVLF